MPGTIWKRGKKDQGPKAKARRAGALARLEENLKKHWDFLTSTKDEFLKKGWQLVIKREEKEINTLKTRI